MTKKELVAKLQEIEWEDFEVKEASANLPKAIWSTVSAFSNTGGGWIILGIVQNGKEFIIQGVQTPEKIEQDFINVLRGDKFNVKIRPLCKKYQLKEGTVIAFYIPVSDKKPVYFNTQANTFIRTGSGDQRGTKEEIDAMYRDQAFGTQTLQTVETTSIKDIHLLSLQQYREYLSRLDPEHAYNRLTDDEFLKKLRVLKDRKLTYGGLLFLGTNDAIQDAIADFRIDYLEIPGISYKDAKVRYTYRIGEHENLWQYYYGLMDRLRRQVELPFQLTTEGFASNDYPQLGALREALVNTLMHTDYFSPSKPRIRVFDDRIEFYNPGALPKPLEQIIAEDISMPRNPIIAKLFRVVKLSENAGYGFDKMEIGWKAYTGNSPLFEADIDSIKGTFYFAKDKQKIGGQIGGQMGGQMGGQIEITQKQKEVYLLIKEEAAISRKKMAQAMGINESALRKHLDALKNKNIIERVGGTRGYWRVIKEIK